MSFRQILGVALLSTLARSGVAQDKRSPAPPPAPGAVATPARVVRHVPVDISLFPPISVNGDAPALNHLSIGLAGAHSAELRGVALAPVHWSDGDVTGVQATSAAASAGGLVRGVQYSHIAVITRDLRGVQLGGAAALARGRAQGLQMAFGAAITLGEMRGAQIALVNFGRDVAGAQIGLVNVARKVSGLQLGLVNVSRTADAAVGLVSVVGDGRHDVELYATELMPINAGARLGGRRIHGILAAGLDPDRVEGTGETRWTAGLGAGGGVDIGRVNLDVDLLAQLLTYDGEEPKSGIGTLRLVAGYRVARHLTPFAGATANLFISEVDRPDVRLGRSVGVGSHGRLWAGFVAGVRI